MVSHAILRDESKPKTYTVICGYNQMLLLSESRMVDADWARFVFHMA